MTYCGNKSALLDLKRAVGKWVDARDAPITGMFGIAQLNDLKNAEKELERIFHNCTNCEEELR